MRRLTTRELVLVGVLAALAVILPLYEVVFAPEVRALSALSGRVHTQSGQLAAATADANRLPDLEREQTAEAARLAAVERRLPATISVSGLMGRLSTAIAASGVQLIEVTFPQGTQPSPSPTEPIQELAFTVRLRGTFDRLVVFLRAIEAAPPVAVEQSLAIAGGQPLSPAAGYLDITVGMKAIALR